MLIFYGLIVLTLLDFGFLGWLVYCQFLQPGAVYYPSKIEAVHKAIKLAKVKEGEKVIDLGSGDGRVLIEFAQGGVFGIGYEINPWLVWLSRRKIKKTGLSEMIEIRWKSMWEANFLEAQIVYVYQFPQFMKKIYEKIKSTERKIRLVTNDYSILGIKPNKTKGKLNLYLIGP